MKFFMGHALLFVVGGLLLLSGCKDGRVAPSPGAKREVHVDTPAGTVDVEARRDGASDGRDVDVNVGPGGVQVNVEGQPLRERLQERRDERQQGSP